MPLGNARTEDKTFALKPTVATHALQFADDATMKPEVCCNLGGRCILCRKYVTIKNEYLYRIA